MSYEEISGLIKEIDNLVCGEGIYLSTWYLDEKEEFGQMLHSAYYSSWWSDNQLKHIYDYENYLENKLLTSTYEERKVTLAKHKELWLTLIQKSEMSNVYHTPNDKDLYNRLIPLARAEYVIPLNSYNFIPEKLLEAHKLDPSIELVRHEVMSFVIIWKKELIRRYHLINHLQDIYTTGGGTCNDWLEWTIDSKQIKQLISLIKRYFLNRTDTDLIVNILIGQEQGNIVWVKSTEALVHLFTLLVEKNYLITRDWGMVLTRRLMFYSKQGNLINNRNINATLYRIRNKEIVSREQKLITKTIERFDLIR
ncbi:hypothetical protein [Spirosoma agri]|uniref:Uncharacterized protein n=1 Tax=Spirosoma agri TaxID=1987381 RepID=A0A6M0IBN8_9BACT|nr:hypothetical protein [Spirosoma agri]NEU65468.1 hypothetical protein [Spirosoma agri]